MGYTIKRFKCDNKRGEYDKLFKMLLAGSGSTFEPCPPHAHHKNGVAERLIATITEKARAMLIDSQAPVHFWGEAVFTAVYLHRRSPNNGLIKRDDRDGYKAPYETPYEMLQAYGKPAIDRTAMRSHSKLPSNLRFSCFERTHLIPRTRRSRPTGTTTRRSACGAARYRAHREFPRQWG